MSKTWKDLPQNVEGAVKRKKPPKHKPKPPPETPVLEEEDEADNQEDI